MRRDGLPAAASWSWIARAFGTGALRPVRYSLRVHVNGQGGRVVETEWAVRRISLEEGLHELYRLEVVAIVGAGELDLDGLVRTRVDFEISRGEDVRVIHGVVLQAELMGDQGDGARVRLWIGPAIELLGLGRRCRVFQGRSVVEIAEAVLGRAAIEHGSALEVDRLVGSYQPRDYCVQYRESDLDFVLRILADEGITVLFDHTGETETVVLVDDNQGLPPAGYELLDETGAAVPGLPYVAEQEGEVPTESIQGLVEGRKAIRSRWAASVWSWKERPPASNSTVMVEGDVRPGETWRDEDEGRPSEGHGSDEPIHDASSRRVMLQRQRDEVHQRRLWARSNATVLRVGSVFELAGPPHDEFGAAWVVTRARHEGEVPDASILGSGDGAGPQYGNEIECQPHVVAVVPERRRRPVVRGVHTAMVTGPEGDGIHTDRFGRIRVRMLWDEQEHAGEETSCWLRVALPWAGDGFGTVFVPRVGTEVVVSFIDGDPDRPLCTGCVFDGATTLPYALPEHRTRTVLRTASTNGDGFHELSFEDAAGQEEIFLHAQRKLREVVRGDHAEAVADTRRTWVGGTRTTAIGKDDLLQVGGDQLQTVEGDLNQRVHGSMRLRIGTSPKEGRSTDGLAVEVERGAVDVVAAEAIVLRCGAARLELRPDEIVLTAPKIVAQCPSQSATHSTAIALTEESVELAADQLRQQVVGARLEADERLVLGTGAQMGSAQLDLADEHVTLRAGGVEVRGKTLALAGTEKTEIKGSTCELGGQAVDVKGNRIGIDADARIEISTPGQVNIRGRDKITLN